MSLRKTQSEFVKCIGKLIQFAYENGYELTFGDVYRDKRVHGKFGEKKSYAAAKSIHKIKLACDFNLFVKDKYISDGTSIYWLILGKYWESLHPLARWGGRFQIKDSCHFSFEYWGCK